MAELSREAKNDVSGVEDCDESMNLEFWLIDVGL